MEAPEKLYFDEREDKGILDIYSGKESDNDIEYVLADAFIEKAYSFIKGKLNDYIIIDIDNKYEGIDGLFFEDFKNYMKGE